jgi:hypothetical protein
VSLLQMARVGAPWPVVGELVREGREGEGEGAWLRASGVGGRGWGAWMQERDQPELLSGSILLFCEEQENCCVR